MRRQGGIPDSVGSGLLRSFVELKDTGRNSIPEEDEEDLDGDE